MQSKGGSLLIVAHVAVREGARGLQIDDQTASGIAQWCRHFQRVTYYGIRAQAGDLNNSSVTWVYLGDLPGTGNCELMVLPRSYRIRAMIREYRKVRATLAKAIAGHAHLCFTIGGLVGDWPAIGALEAMRQGRRFSTWIDRVEPDVIRNRLSVGSHGLRAVASVALPIMELYTRHLLSNSTVALLQGHDTFDHYAKWASDAHCTYDTHTKESDEISKEALSDKIARITSGRPLRIVYVGRAAAMKGPLDWLSTLERILELGVPFQATWVGDGPSLSLMKSYLQSSPLSDYVQLPGFDGDRESLLSRMRESDILLFCHKTSESPRCLIEALVSGCALVGYRGGYPEGLAHNHGGAVFAPRNDVHDLAQRVVVLHRDRGSLARLIGRAATSGSFYNEDSVYEHRAKLMRLA